jgi:hypothetical protein
MYKCLKINLLVNRKPENTEGVIADKKKMEKDNPEAFDNRMIAKNMTSSEFETWYRKQKNA